MLPALRHSRQLTLIECPVKIDQGCVRGPWLNIVLRTIDNI